MNAAVVKQPPEPLVIRVADWIVRVSGAVVLAIAVPLSQWLYGVDARGQRTAQQVEENMRRIAASVAADAEQTHDLRVIRDESAKDLKAIRDDIAALRVAIARLETKIDK